MDTIQPLLFWLIALTTAVCAIATVVSQNIVRSATWLLFTLAGTSGVFFLLGADLVGAIQLLVYVGGTLVLVVFGVMLTAQGPFINMKSSGAEWAISAVVGLLLLGVLTVGITTTGKGMTDGKLKPPEGSIALHYAPNGPLITQAPERVKLRAEYQKELEEQKITKEEYDAKLNALERAQAANSNYSATIGQGFLGVGVGPAHEETVNGVTRPVRAHYLLPFEIVSVHLLVVLIGAAYLARAKRRRSVA
jgi:NADH-quinone oxidoreductase subunit J